MLQKHWKDSSTSKRALRTLEKDRTSLSVLSMKSLPQSLRRKMYCLYDDFSGAVATDKSWSGNNGTVIGSPSLQRAYQHVATKMNGSNAGVHRNSVPFWTTGTIFCIARPQVASGSKDVFRIADSVAIVQWADTNFTWTPWGTYSTNITGSPLVSQFYAITFNTATSKLKYFLNNIKIFDGSWTIASPWTQLVSFWYRTTWPSNFSDKPFTLMGISLEEFRDDEIALLYNSNFIV